MSGNEFRKLMCNQKGVKMTKVSLFFIFITTSILVYGSKKSDAEDQHTTQVNVFQCDKAKSVIEKKICTSPKLLDLETKMNFEYRNFFKILSSKEKRATKRNQKSWIKLRETSCHSDSDIDKCITEYTNERIDAISAVSKSVSKKSKCSIDCRFEILVAKVGLDTESGGGASFYTSSLSKSCNDSKAAKCDLGNESEGSIRYVDQLSCLYSFLKSYCDM
jgi:uncharacterized protein YecT (DUF1311 family)